MTPLLGPHQKQQTTVQYNHTSLLAGLIIKNYGRHMAYSGLESLNLAALVVNGAR